MAKKRKPMGRLTPMQVAEMIKTWDDKTVEEFAELFSVGPGTIVGMAKEVRKADPALCPSKGGRKRSDVVADAFKLLEKE